MQGGTGIYFGYGFDSEGNLLERGGLNLEGIVKKIIIPHEIKAQIATHLYSQGIYSDLLYDEFQIAPNNNLSYVIQEFENRSKAFGQKVSLGIYVSELSFTDEDIRRIIEEVYHKYKIRYGKSARIFICVYHDAEDRRLTSSNWIAKIIPDDTFIDYTISFNSDYRTHRMINMNKEFSIFEIMSLLEPGIKECKAFLKEIRARY